MPYKRSSERFGFLLIFLLIGSQCCLHLLQGSDLSCTAILALTLLLAVAVACLGGLYDTMVWITLYFVARYVWIASLVKILLGQPIDSNLNHPIESYAMVLIWLIEIILIYFILRLFGFRRILFEDCKDVAFLRRVSGVCFLIAVPVCILTCLNAKEDADLAGFRVFADNIFPLAIITRAAYVSLRYENGKLWDVPLLIMLVASLLLSLLSGTKMLAFNSLVVYVVTTASFQRSVPVRLVVFGSLTMAFFVVLVTPAVNALRDSAAMYQKTFTERFDELAYSITSGNIKDTVGKYSDDQNIGNNYYEYFGPIGRFAPVADRIALVQTADVIKTGIDMNGQMGLHWIGEAFVQLIPRVLMPDKDLTLMSDHILWHAGVRSRAAPANYPSMGLLAGSYAMAGWPGVVIAPFLLTTVFFLAQKLWAGTSSGNIMAIYFFGRHAHAFVEYDVTSLIIHILRVIPIDYLLVIIIFKLLSYKVFNKTNSANLGLPLAGGPRAPGGVMTPEAPRAGSPGC